MPQLFKIGNYWVYFWSNEGIPVEPVLVHVFSNSPVQNATKIWITRAGKCLVDIRLFGAVYPEISWWKLSIRMSRGRVRKAKAIDDISGDYKQYANIEKLAVGKDIVIVEGDNRSFCTAIWHKNGYSYSITLQDGVSRQAIGALVADIL